MFKETFEEALGNEMVEGAAALGDLKLLLQ